MIICLMNFGKQIRSIFFTHSGKCTYLKSHVLSRLSATLEANPITYDECYSNWAHESDIVTTTMTVDASPSLQNKNVKGSILIGYYCHKSPNDLYQYLTDPTTNSFIQLDLGATYPVSLVKVAHKPNGAAMNNADVYVGSSTTYLANTFLPRIETLYTSTTFGASTAVQGQYVIIFGERTRIDAGEIQVIVYN